MTDHIFTPQSAAIGVAAPNVALPVAAVSPGGQSEPLNLDASGNLYVNVAVGGGGGGGGTGTQTVVIVGTVPVTGTVDVAGTSTVVVSGGTVDVAGTSTVVVSGGTVDVAGTSTVIVSGGTVDVAGTSTVVVSGGTINVANVVAPNVPGTAPNSAVLVAQIAATATPTISGGQSAPLYSDIYGSNRVNPYGSPRSFSSVTGTNTITASIVLTVPQNTKWLVKSVCMTINPSTTVTRQFRIYVQDAAGVYLLDTFTGVFTPTNTIAVRATLGQGLAVATQTLAGVVAAYQAGCPDLLLGPSFTITGAVQSAAGGTFTQTLSVNAHILPD